jgi:choline-sulfatase
MLFLALSFPHCPYTAPEPWYSMYDPDDVPPLTPAELPDQPDFVRLIRQYRRLDELDEGTLRKIMAVYLGMVSYMDHLLGKVLDALDAAGLSSDTTVFAFSDHGDWAGDRGLVEKWPSGLHDDLTRIPMIVRMPGGAAGHVARELVECFDIMPTTLDLAGIPCRHTHFARSMLAQLQGKAGDPERAAFADGGYDVHEPHCFEGKPSDRVCGNPDGIYYPKGLQQQERPESVCRASMIRTATHKLVRRTGGCHELYDLRDDPRECRNLHGKSECRDVQTALTERMLDWYIHTADAVPWDANPRGFADKP